MPAPVTLPRTSWGRSDAPRRALLIHGLGSAGSLMWRFGVHLADRGWRAEAVDLRGHGLAPRALDYTIAAYAADVAGCRPDGGHGAGWDLVVGHSLGAAAATLVAAAEATWTSALLLIDPALHLQPDDREAVRASQEAAFADPTPGAVRAEHPDWHEQDVELKALAVRQASRWAVEQTSIQNPVWDVTAAAAALALPAHVIASDPEVYSIFAGKVDRAVLAANPRLTMSVIEGAGHSPHRDDPERTLAAVDDALRILLG